MNALEPASLSMDLLKASGAMDRPVGSRLGSALNPNSSLGPKPTLEEVAGFFERMLMEMMVKSMRETVQTTDLFGRSLGADHFVGYLDSLYVEMAAERSSTPFREALIRQFQGASGVEPESSKESMEKEANPKAASRFA
ncbi:MAG: hypothetical protein BWZ10_00494 [candidate division BRC1 bacterium ADurb.BinA364]|nr:MAG: hypothetical protein BWZ10_00494 [candidate division BRC1 bacterium ADurb.BinA364]